MRLFCVIFKHFAFDSKLQSLWKLAKLIILAFFKKFFCSENETFSEIFKPCVVCTKKTYQNQCWFHDDFSRTGWGYKPLTYLYIASKPNRFLLSSPNEMIFLLLACKFWPKKKINIWGALLQMPIRKLETQVLSFLMSFHSRKESDMCII